VAGAIFFFSHRQEAAIAERRLLVCPVWRSLGKSG
jgi:hypothetical protein